MCHLSSHIFTFVHSVNSLNHDFLSGQISLYFLFSLAGRVTGDECQSVPIFCPAPFFPFWIPGFFVWINVMTIIYVQFDFFPSPHSARIKDWRLSFRSSASEHRKAEKHIHILPRYTLSFKWTKCHTIMLGWGKPISDKNSSAKPGKRARACFHSVHSSADHRGFRWLWKRGECCY